ncbi:PIN domain-containing protein [Desulfococcaceae bacterium HSG7]|nr:PIN domain-containing protein [Desulfococcaceae bacterium HSG7]
MRTNYILIDYENVQPLSFVFNQEHPFKVLLFVGANQIKIPIELAMSMQALGDNAQYIQIAGNGKNALDFHIAYYLGKLVEKDPNGYFHIISKDFGFDVLINFMRGNKVSIKRHKQIDDIPLLKLYNSKSLNETIEVIINSLRARGNSKPRKVEALSNTINALFMKTLGTEELDKVIKVLAQKNFVTIEGTEVRYNLNEKIP